MNNILLKSALKKSLFALTFLCISSAVCALQDVVEKKPPRTLSRNQRVFYGKASFYANKFHGRRTANGEIFSQDKFTAACNVLPLGTWIRVTNLKNGKSVKVKTTDRLHPRMRRLVDLSRSAAKKLGYIKSGLTRVKVEVLDQKKNHR